MKVIYEILVVIVLIFSLAIGIAYLSEHLEDNACDYQDGKYLNASCQETLKAAYECSKDSDNALWAGFVERNCYDEQTPKALP